MCTFQIGGSGKPYACRLVCTSRLCHISNSPKRQIHLLILLLPILRMVCLLLGKVVLGIYYTSLFERIIYPNRPEVKNCRGTLSMR